MLHHPDDENDNSHREMNKQRPLVFQMLNTY